MYLSLSVSSYLFCRLAGGLPVLFTTAGAANGVSALRGTTGDIGPLSLLRNLGLKEPTKRPWIGTTTPPNNHQDTTTYPLLCIHMSVHVPIYTPIYLYIHILYIFIIYIIYILHVVVREYVGLYIHIDVCISPSMLYL